MAIEAADRSIIQQCDSRLLFFCFSCFHFQISCWISYLIPMRHNDMGNVLRLGMVKKKKKNYLRSHII